MGTPRPRSAAGPVRFPAAPRARWVPYAELTKPGLTSLVLATTAFGFLLASGPSPRWGILAAAIAGTALVGGGANGLNQWFETAADARMRRTRGRPFPSKRLSRRSGALFSGLLTGAGLLLLHRLVNPLTAGLALASWGIYLLAYTPLKARTPLNTLVGACSGAIPPLLGWTAASGRLEAGAGVLFAILFVWQIPHFLAIAWVHRRDYAAAGFRMLPAEDPQGRATFRIVLVYCVGLFPVTLAAGLVGLAGWLYAAGATVLGLAMLHAAVGVYRERSVRAARRLFLTSVAYLPGLFALMLLDPTRLPRPGF